MIVAFGRATAGRFAADQLHVEYFSAREEAATEGGFTVQLARTGRSLAVLPGQTILEVLEAAGLNVPNGCREGICGSCETGVIEGVPDHRDAILSARERAAGRTMMICCSGSKTASLVLDL